MVHNKCGNCERRRVFVYFLILTETVCLFLQLLGHFRSTSVTFVTWENKSREGLGIHDWDFDDDASKIHFTVVVVFLIIANLAGTGFLVALTISLLKPTTVVIIRHIMQLGCASIQFYALLISTWMYSRAVKPGSETWPICVLIAAFAISNLPLLALLFQKVERSSATPSIPIMINDYGQSVDENQRKNQQKYFFGRRICIIIATLLAPASYFGAAAHLTLQTTSFTANATINFYLANQSVVNNFINSTHGPLFTMVQPVVSEKQNFAIVNACSNLTLNERMAVYTFAILGSSLNFFFCLILTTVFCTVQKKKLPFFLPTIIIGLFVLYSWLVEAWLITRATASIKLADNPSYQFSIAKLAVFNVSIIAFWGAIIKFDLNKKKGFYEVVALKGRIANRDSKMGSEASQKVASPEKLFHDSEDNQGVSSGSTKQREHLLVFDQSFESANHLGVTGSVKNSSERPRAPEVSRPTPPISPTRSSTPGKRSSTISTVAMSYTLTDLPSKPIMKSDYDDGEEPFYDESPTIASLGSKKERKLVSEEEEKKKEKKETEESTKASSDGLLNPGRTPDDTFYSAIPDANFYSSVYRNTPDDYSEFV